MKLRHPSSLFLAGAVVALGACSDQATAPATPSATSAAAASASIGINVLLTGPLTAAQRSQLSALGTVLDEIPQINALTMRISSGQLSAVQGLSFVAAAGPDADRKGSPIDAVAAGDFEGGLSTWNLDAVNITTGPGASTRAVAETGNGVYVGVLDSGLLDSWRQYFPEERIAEEYARAFGGGGGEVGTVSSQPNTWEHDQNSHGTHVASTILGYQFTLGRGIAGVAPAATVIPVKVLNQTGGGWGWSSVIARGIVYIADLKAGPLAASPVAINMSLGGSVLDPVEKAAIEYAIGKGVIIVAAAGNEGLDGMSYPGAYAPVISVAAAGLKAEFSTGSSWWRTLDVADPTKGSDFFIADFSSRSIKAEQDLDVTAPGVSVVGPYQLNSGQLSYYYLGGTSMASPHVAGIVALMQEKNPALTAAQAESILEGASVSIQGASAAEQGKGLVQANSALSKVSTRTASR